MPVAVVAAVVVVSLWVGARIGAARERMNRIGIDPKWARQAEDYLREVVTSPSPADDLDEVVVLPKELRERGRRLLWAAPGAAERRDAPEESDQF